MSIDFPCTQQNPDVITMIYESMTIIYHHKWFSCSTRPVPSSVLHRIGFARALVLHLEDLPETATTQEVHQLETVGAHLPGTSGTDPNH